MKIVFVSYNYLPQYTSPQQWINKISPSAIIMEALGEHNTVSYVKQIGYTGNYSSNGVDYYFLNAHERSRFPRQLHSQVKKLEPDVVLVPGFHFPLQIIQLRLQIGKKVKIILEHHADKPLTGLKKILQKIADKNIDAYHFTSLGNAKEWLDAKIIRNKNKCYEIPANSSYFSNLGKQKSRQELGLTANLIFLWVGRLEKNKDPLTVIKGFEKYLAIDSCAQLHMIYQIRELFTEIDNLINGNQSLKQAIIFHGSIEHSKLNKWYSAADYFISGSHREGGSIALLEAMSCGCIPIVTAIPSALKVIEGGKFGLYYEAGNADELFQKLQSTNAISTQTLSADVEIYFKENLSPAAIAKRFITICDQLISK